jgi:L-cysteine:1D-myo-inositol 2-amino-2-deoxy-alpha-D-glucopyranoside ligase
MNSWASLDIPEIGSAYLFPPLSLFDTASASKKPLEVKNLYRLYVCGITPYDATHLGHAATYLAFDLAHRYLLATGAEVRFVQNITDIDDPLLERAARDGQDWRQLAQSQIDLFRGDMVNLHIIPPAHYIGVVEAMPLIIDAISLLESKGSTYAIENDLYFSTRSDVNFGSRSHLSEDEMATIFAQRGGDPLRPGKRDSLDALLWLGKREGEPFWDSPFGEGRPGWHIECSAIALAYLQPDENSGACIDIQGGGSDLIFPHHEMSATQVAISTGREFASHYVHAGMIGLDGEKMSKSLGNLIFVSQLVESGVDPMAIRWALMNGSYGVDRMWERSFFDEATVWIERLRSALSRVDVAPTASVISAIITSQSDNLDTTQTLSEIKRWIVATESGEEGGHAGELSRFLDSLLGLAL